MKLKNFYFLIYLTIFSCFLACSDYQKILKSSDYNLKYDRALQYFQKKDWVRAIGLFEELITVTRGSYKAEKVLYYYAYSHYHMGDFTMAHYFFETFLRNYPKSEHVEDISYLSAYCLYRDSPHYMLDQKNTVRAIDELQSFINRYPESSRVEEANNLIDELREKLEQKAYSRAMLYYNMENFNSAIVAFEVLMKEFPDTKYRAEASFLILKSNYLYAIRSIDEKKPKRLETTIQYYTNFVDRFAKSKYMKEAEQIYTKSKQLLENIREKQNS